jgi:hypothetical protein
MAAEQEVKSMKGVVTGKEEAVIKTGDNAGNAYWRFTIEGKKFSLWDYNKGKDIKSGTAVEVLFTETVGQGQRGEVTYRNIKDIRTIESKVEVTTERVNDSADLAPPPTYDELTADKFELGMAKNNAAVLTGAIMDYLSKVQPDVKMSWEGDIANGITSVKKIYWQIVNDLFTEGAQVRKKQLGY